MKRFFLGVYNESVEKLSFARLSMPSNLMNNFQTY